MTDPTGTNHESAPSGEKPGFFDRRGVRRALWYAMVALCVGFAAAGFLIDVHPYFPVEEFGAFYAIFGFLAFTLIILSGPWLRRILMRPEDYYDE